MRQITASSTHSSSPNTTNTTIAPLTSRDSRLFHGFTDITALPLQQMQTHIASHLCNPAFLRESIETLTLPLQQLL